MGHRRRSDQTQMLVEAWVPACAGMARKGNSRSVTMFIEGQLGYSLLRREDEDEGIALNHLYASKH